VEAARLLLDQATHVGVHVLARVQANKVGGKHQVALDFHGGGIPFEGTANELPVLLLALVACLKLCVLLVKLKFSSVLF
jgi:hypothetical protein